MREHTSGATVLESTASARPISPFSRDGASELLRLSRSLRCAARGLWEVLSTQRNARIHVVAGVSVISLGVWLQVSALALALLCALITLVGAAEAFNTAIEAVVDLASPNIHPLARRAKDVAAGAVLLCAFGAAASGVLILGPALFHKIVG